MKECGPQAGLNLVADQKRIFFSVLKFVIYPPPGVKILSCENSVEGMEHLQGRV